MRKALLVSTLLLFSPGAPVLSAAHEAQEARKNANSPMARLRSDIQQALQNGNPTQAELATLEESLATLKEARAAREQGQPVDRQRVESALRETEKVFQSNSFRRPIGKQFNAIFRTYGVNM